MALIIACLHILGTVFSVKHLLSIPSRLKRTPPTSDGVVTAVKNCCTNCGETSRPNNGCSIYGTVLGKPAKQIRWMADAAHHKSG